MAAMTTSAHLRGGPTEMLMSSSMPKARSLFGGTHGRVGKKLELPAEAARPDGLHGVESYFLRCLRHGDITSADASSRRSR